MTICSVQSNFFLPGRMINYSVKNRFDQSYFLLIQSQKTTIVLLIISKLILIYMDLNTMIALGIFSVVLSLIGYKSLNNYFKHNREITTSDQKAAYENKILNLSTELDSITNSRNGYKQKLNFLKTNYDFEFDEDEMLSDPSVEEDKIIPAIASAIFPKMPGKLKELLGNEDIEKAIFGAAEKNPKLIGEWVSKFFSKKEEPKSITNVLKEKYL